MFGGTDSWDRSLPMDRGPDIYEPRSFVARVGQGLPGECQGRSRGRVELIEELGGCEAPRVPRSALLRAISNYVQATSRGSGVRGR